jgi:hypothetical protein
MTVVSQLRRPGFGLIEVEHATAEEIIEFVNKARAAGGADVLDALLPSHKGNAYNCLIANALNFSCAVDGAFTENSRGDRPATADEIHWGMFLPSNMDEKRARTIASALDCPLVVRALYSERDGRRGDALRIYNPGEAEPISREWLDENWPGWWRTRVDSLAYGSHFIVLLPKMIGNAAFAYDQGVDFGVGEAPA